MRPVYINVSQTSAAAGVAVVPLDVNISPAQTSYSVTNVSGNIRGNVALTLDNIWAANWDQSTATWLGQASATNFSASVFGSIVNMPFTALRFTLTSGIYSGGATLSVVQAGTGGGT